MGHKRLVGFLGLVAAGAMVLSACSGGKTTEKPAEQPSPQQPMKPAVGGEMTYAVVADPDTFAPFWYSSAYAQDVVLRVMGPGLLRIGYDMKPEPALAEALPTVSADNKTYTFKVRKNVKFHDGKPMTAKDIKLAYDVLMSKDYAGRQKSSVAALESVEAPDDYTVVMKTKEVFAPFLFGAASIHPLPSHLLQNAAVKDMPTLDLWKKPVGVGSWKFADWKSGQYSLLERNPDYFELNAPGVKGGTQGLYVEKLRIRVIPENNTEVAALEAGELTFSTSMEPADADRLKVEKKDQLVAYDWNRMGYGYQTFNNEKFPTNIKEIRQALSYAVNRPAIIQGVLNGKATVPPGFIPPVHWAFDKSVKGYEYNPKKAEELIQAAGFKKNANGIYEKDGKPLKLTYVGTKGSGIVEGVALQSQKDWKSIGVETELLLVDFNTLLDKHLKPGELHVTFSGLGFSVDPHYSFEGGYHSKNITLDAKGVNQGSNTARYKNTKIDELIDKGRVTVDVNERLKIYQEAQKIIIDDAPANWIYVNLFTDMARKDLKGIVNWDGYGMSFESQWFLKEQ